MHDPRTDWCYRTEPEPSLNGRSLDWPRGRSSAGRAPSTACSTSEVSRGTSDHWRQLGNAGWSFEDVLPYFIRAEDQERGADEWHGAGGPLGVSDMRVRRDVCDAFIAGAEEIGIPRNADVNGANQEGAGYFQLTMRKGFRCSTAAGYLRPARRRPNLSIVTGAHVQRLCFEGRRAVGVRYAHRGRGARCAGAGGGAALRGRDRLAADPPALGGRTGGSAGAPRDRAGARPARCRRGTSRDHLQLRAVYKCTRPTLNDEVNHPLRKMLIGIEYILKRSGPMSMGASQVYAFVRTRPELETARHPVPLPAPERRQAGGGPAPLLGVHLIGMPAPPGEPRPGPHQASRPLRLPGHRAELPRHRAGPRDGGGRLRMTRAIAGTRAMRPFVEEELPPRTGSAHRRGAVGGGTGHRGDHLSPGGDVRDGAGNERGGR